MSIGEYRWKQKSQAQIEESVETHTDMSGKKETRKRK